MAAVIPPGVADALGFVDLTETWEDRLKPGKYTSPSGTAINFDFTEVAREVEARGTVFQFPGVDGAYVQRKGYGPRIYPMRVRFSGANHDRIALAFEAALLEPGIGELQHPMYGTFDVTPLGRITRRNDLVRGRNLTVIEVSFFTTFKRVYPRATSNAKSEIEAALGNFDVQAAQDFEASMDLDNAVKRANAKATIKSFLKDVSASLQRASDSVADVRREMQDTIDLINEGIDVLIGQPLLLARQCVNLVRAPARAITGIESRLADYQALAQRIIGSAAAAPGEALAAGSGLAQRVQSIANDFLTSDLFLLSSVAGGVDSAVRTEFRTRSDALLAAATVQSQLDDATDWRDAGFEDLQGLEVSPAQVDTGAGIQALNSAVSATLAYLVAASFSLRPEKRLVLDRPRSIIDLVSELYGTVDDALDRFINENQLTGSEILELPRGRLVVYYPDAD